MLRLAVPRSIRLIPLSGSRGPWAASRFYSLKRPEGEYENEVFSILEKEFQPTSLMVQDISGGCGSMFAIVIESNKFQGLTPVKQQKLVYQALSDEVAKWHGLQLRTKVSQS